MTNSNAGEIVLIHLALSERVLDDLDVLVDGFLRSREIDIVDVFCGTEIV